MSTCKWVPKDDKEAAPCGAEGFFEFGPLVFCEEHARQTYDRFEEINRQLVWYLELREKFAKHD